MTHATTPSTDQTSLLGWLGALADATRLRLLRLLERHELGVADLCDVLQLPQSTVSRHLKTLADAGMVRSRRRGTAHLYRLTPEELDAGLHHIWSVTRPQSDAWPAVRQDALRLSRLLRDREDTRQFFAGKAGEWDRLRGELYGHAFSCHALFSLLPRDYTVADLGCGTGDVLADLAPLCKTVIGIDNSDEMLAAAKQRLAPFKNVQLKQGDLLDLPLKDASLDAALLMLAMSYLPDPEPLLGEMHRVLKPGGRAVVVDLVRHDRDDFRRELAQHTLGYEADDVQALLTAAGFSDATFQPLTPESGTKGPALFVATAVKVG